MEKVVRCLRYMVRFLGKQSGVELLPVFAKVIFMSLSATRRFTGKFAVHWSVCHCSSFVYSLPGQRSCGRIWWYYGNQRWLLLHARGKLVMIVNKLGIKKPAMLETSYRIFSTVFTFRSYYRSVFRRFFAFLPFVCWVLTHQYGNILTSSMTSSASVEGNFFAPVDRSFSLLVFLVIGIVAGMFFFVLPVGNFNANNSINVCDAVDT